MQILLAFVFTCGGPCLDAGPTPGTLSLRARHDGASGRTVRAGSFTVWENRSTRSGRTIDLELVVVEAEATGDGKRPDPIFFIAGGPGQGAARLGHMFGDPLGTDRDLVFLSQRGTGGSNGLRCPLPDRSPGMALEELWDVARFEVCRDELARHADLTQYTTPIAADDLDEVRAALGYDRINLIGGSYGTRFSLVYMRRHPETVRSAVLKGVAPVAFRNPLHHAREAQQALERIFEACARDTDCHEAYPQLEAEFQAVLARLDAQPADVSVRDPASGGRVGVVFDRSDFATALRLRMYGNTSEVPWLIHRAFLEDFNPIAEFAIAMNQGLDDALAMGMLLCVTCNEDVSRIDAAEIDAATAGTFLGSRRVRAQMAACAIWPRAEVPPGYGDPVTARVPTLVLSGAYDPVTGPRWGDEAARHLPLAMHVVVPQTHAIGGPCVDALVAEFLDRGTTEALDTSCVRAMTLPRFR